MKECPEWMQFSTITSAEHLPSVQQTSSSETWSAAQSTTGTVLIKLNSPPQTMMTIVWQMYNEMRKSKQNC